MIWILMLVLSTQAGATDKSDRQFKLSDIVHNSSLTGNHSDSIEDRDLIEHQFEGYIQFRYGQISLEKMLELMADCTSQLEWVRSPFCPLILSPSSKKSAFRKDRQRRKKFIRSILANIQKGNLNALSNVKESDILIAIRRFGLKGQVESWIRKVLTSKVCYPSVFMTALGLKVESKFPSEYFKKLAIQLYDRASSCGRDSSSIQASYRLGLMRIWEGRCDQAEEVLSRIPDIPQGSEFRLRTAYWRLYCAQILKDKLREQTLEKWLTKEYPSSLHELLILSNREGIKTPPIEDSDPNIDFRSTLDPGVNSAIRAVEVLLTHGEQDAASDLMGMYSPRVQLTEISLQLYWAVLLKRAGDESASFQIISNIFRENTRFMVRSTLELLYPLNYLELVRELNPSMDPLLVLSLMRQESAFDPMATSSAGALGLMQIQLASARRFGVTSRKQLYNPRKNIQVGIRYLDRLIKRYNKQVGLALAAYNAGPQRMKDLSKRYPLQNRLLFLDLLPLRETREYVSSIARNYYWYLKLYSPDDFVKAEAHGFDLLQFLFPKK